MAEAGREKAESRISWRTKIWDDLAKILNLNIINFDLNKSDIRPDVQFENMCDVCYRTLVWG
jgi:hypothetical protein